MNSVSSNRGSVLWKPAFLETLLLVRVFFVVCLASSSAVAISSYSFCMTFIIIYRTTTDSRFFFVFFRQPTRSLLLTTRSFISKYSWHERERTLNGQNWFRETRTINGQLLQESAVCKAYCVTPQFWLIIRAASYPTTVGYWRPTTKNVMLKRKLKSKCSTVFAGQLWQSTRRRPLLDGSVGCVVLFIYFSLSFQKRSMHLVF